MTCTNLRALSAVALGLLVGVSAACAGPQQQPQTQQPQPPGAGASGPTQDAQQWREPQVRAGGLDVPWGVDFLSDGSVLVAERSTGLLRRVGENGAVSTLGEVPGVVARGEGGLLGVAVGSDQQVYAYLTAQGENRVVRAVLSGSDLGAFETIVDGIPAGGVHNGGRIAFGPDGALYIGTGDAGSSASAQDERSLAGKILRVNPDGSVPADNPDPGSPVFSLGHRNVQGLAWDEQGRLWASEFGANEWDELNQVEPGGNYGWPLVEGEGAAEGMTAPRVVWRTNEASPSGLAYADGSLWVAALRGQRLWQVPLDAQGRTGAPVAHLSGEFGRLRTVVERDGALWLTTSNTDGRGRPAADDDRLLLIELR